LAVDYPIWCMSIVTCGKRSFSISSQRTDAFEVVITDLGMAQIDGHRVAASIKTVCSATPVFLLTDWGKRTPAEGAIPNIDHVLSKPLRIADIRTVLAGVCAQSQY
jgi:CheY-like chemotaxis protein